MKYLRKEPFSVKMCPDGMTDSEWDAIFAPKCPECGKAMNTHPNFLRGHICKIIFDGTIKKGKKGKKA